MDKMRNLDNQELYKLKREVKRSTSSPPNIKAQGKQDKNEVLHQFKADDAPEESTNKKSNFH